MKDWMKKMNELPENAICTDKDGKPIIVHPNVYGSKVTKQDDLEECPRCSGYDKLRYAYGANAQLLYPKKVCHDCKGEMEDSDQRAFNSYYFGR